MTMGFDLTKLGQWSDEKEFKVEADRTKAYAAATNDTNPQHVNGELAPPVFAVVPIWEAMGMAVMQVTPPELALMVVHGEQDMFLHRPITPGMVTRSKAAPVGVHVKPSGTTVVAKTETRDDSGNLLVEMFMTSFFRGASEGDGAGEQAPSHSVDSSVRDRAPVAAVTYHLDDDQTYRYAEASGDHMPIHLDENIAKSVGFPGIIIHGLCTMAFTSRAVIEHACGGDPQRLARLAVRFSRPVLPGQDITTTIWSAGDRDGRKVFAFETVNQDGVVVIKDGLGEVAG
jgi:acyl dehydratase